MSRLRARASLSLLLARHAFLPRIKPAHPRRILIAHHLLLGDTIMLTPLLAKLRHVYPEAELYMTAPKAIAPIYSGRPYGVRALAYDPRDSATLAAWRQQVGFDSAYIPADNRYSWFARALGAQWIVAFGNDRPRYKNMPVDEALPLASTPCALGDMIATLAGPGPPPPFNRGDWPAPMYSPFDLPANPYCVLHIGARNPTRIWSPEKWAALAERLTEKKLLVVWSGTSSERHWIEQADPARRFPRYTDLDLPQLWQLLRQSRLLVSSDTGIAHLARPIGVPSIVLFGPGDRTLFGLGNFWQYSTQRLLQGRDMACRDQSTLFKRQLTWMRHCSRTPNACMNNGECLQALTPADVDGAVTEILKQ